jgi:hypothetical protein
MQGTKYTDEEISRRGKEFYESRIRSEVEPSHRGEFVVIDVERGDYFIGDSYSKLLLDLWAARPGSQGYVVRVGYPTAGRMGSTVRK